MPQRILSLDITDSDLKATLLQTTFRDYRVAAFYRERVSATGGTLDEQVCRFVSQHVEAGDTVLSALPGSRVTWRTMFLPFRDNKRLMQTIPFELESSVPFGIDDVVIDCQVLHRDRAGSMVLAALVPKQELERHLELLRRAGVDPKIVDVGPLASLNFLSLVPDLPPTFVFVDLTRNATTTALYRQGELVGLRMLTGAGAVSSGDGNGSSGSAEQQGDAAIGRLVGEVRWTLLALNGAPLDEQLPCYVAGEEALVDAVQPVLTTALLVEIRRFDRLPLHNLSDDVRADAPAFSSSLGLALREAVPTNSLGMNFRRGEFTFRQSQQELRRVLRGVAALAALVVALTVVDLYMDYRQLGARAAAVEAQIQKVFSATLPDMGRVANPMVQLQEEIDSLREGVELLSGVVPVSSSTSIDVLRAVSAAVPKKIRIDSEEYTMDADAVRLRANTETFESVDAIKQDLLDTGFFSDVQVKDAKAGKGGNGVDFRMTLVLKKDFRLLGEQR